MLGVFENYVIMMIELKNEKKNKKNVKIIMLFEKKLV
jgi:hypothetical protein